MTEITTMELKQKISNKESFVLDLYATWCGPCKIMKESLKKVQVLKESNEDLNFNIYTYDIDSDKEYVVNHLGIRSVPTLKFYKDGVELHSSRGAISPNDVIQIWNNL